MLFVGSNLPTQLETKVAFQLCPRGSGRFLIRGVVLRCYRKSLEKHWHRQGRGSGKRPQSVSGWMYIWTIPNPTPCWDSGFCSIRSTKQSWKSPQSSVSSIVQMSRLRFTGWKQLVQSHRARECQMQNESSDFQTPGRHIAAVSGQWSFLIWAWMNINLHATDIYWMSHVQYWECNRPTKQSYWGYSPWKSLLTLKILLTDTVCYLLHCVFTFFLLWDPYALKRLTGWLLLFLLYR